MMVIYEIMKYDKVKLYIMILIKNKFKRIFTHSETFGFNL